MSLHRRAESVERAKLVESFVDIGPLFSLLSSADHQIIYGRRGTGKTHALLYLSETRLRQNDIPIYIDMRTIGSTNGIYADESIPFSERGTRLLLDTMTAVHDGILDHVTSHEDDAYHIGKLHIFTDGFATSLSEVTVSGLVQVEETTATTSTAQQEEIAALVAKARELGLELRSSNSSTTQIAETVSARHFGHMRHRVHFGRVGSALQRLVDQLGGRRVWLLLDEWSVIPLPLQPILADLIRRCVFPIRGVTVKIAAIEQRTRFREIHGEEDIGLEIGADAFADLNLDDFMVFDNDAEKATASLRTFYSDMSRRHRTTLMIRTFHVRQQT